MSGPDYHDPDSLSSSIDGLSSQIKAWKDQEASRYGQEPSPSSGTTGTNWSTASAVASGVALVLIVIWTGFQWRAMSIQRTAMRIQSRHIGDLLPLIQQTAEAAASNARSAEQSLHVLIDKERARLEVSLTLADHGNTAESARVSVRIRNSGHTDAIGVKSKAACDISDRKNAGKESPDWHHSNRIEPGGDDSFDVVPMPPLTDEELRRIRRGETTIHVRLHTEFTDVFGIKRHVHGAYRLQTLLPEGPGAPRFDWIANPTKCYETEERHHQSVKAPATLPVTTEPGSLLKL